MTLLDRPTELAEVQTLDQRGHERDEIIAIRGATRVFGHGPERVVALDRIDLTVRRGEMVSLLGASGRVALMFQESALFPWLTVRGNIETALRLRGVARKDRRPQAMSLLESVRLEDFGERRPHELSGGMRQRAALARALAQNAEVLLMDEPFGALDAITREVLHAELERQWIDHDLTVVFVTHDVREAVRLGDRVVLLSSRPGRVEADFSVTLPRPRRIDDAAVNELVNHITAELHREVRRHAND